MRDIAERVVLDEEAADHGIAQQVLTVRRRVTARSTIPVEQRVTGSSRRRFGLGGVDHRLEPRQLVLRGCEDDLVLGLVLVVHGGLRDADGVGDHLQRRATGTVLREQVEGRRDDAGLGRGRRDQRLAGLRGRLGVHVATLPEGLSSLADRLAARRRRGHTAGGRAKLIRGPRGSAARRRWGTSLARWRAAMPRFRTRTKRAVLRAVAVAFVAVIALDKPDVSHGPMCSSARVTSLSAARRATR